jgi:hypothetical protein
MLRPISAQNFNQENFSLRKTELTVTAKKHSRIILSDCNRKLKTIRNEKGEFITKSLQVQNRSFGAFFSD